MKGLLLVIEVNLVLWIVALFSTHFSAVSVIGFVVAAVAQHAAYVRIYRAGPERGAPGRA